MIAIEGHNKTSKIDLQKVIDIFSELNLIENYTIFKNLVAL